MSHGQEDSLSKMPHSGLHVAIIMDGSGRWGQARGLPRVEGHRTGRIAVCRTVTAASRLGIRVLTLFTFSTENWGRPESEVTELMRVFEGFFRVEAPAFVREGIQVTVVGRRDRLPDSLRDAIQSLEKERPSGERLCVRLAIDYSGRESILDAAWQFRHTLDPSAEEFTRLVAGSDGDGADIDLLIRTGGEQRLSNCPLWEIAYAELYFTACLWPDFGPTDLEAAVQDFRKRERRFGCLPALV